MYALQGLREVVPISLSQNIDELPGHLQQQHGDELPVSPLYMQRCWARISRQYMHQTISIAWARTHAMLLT